MNADWLAAYNRMGEVLGEDHAKAIVNNLVTKRDLAEFEARLMALLVQQGRSNLIVLGTSLTALTAIFSFVVYLIVSFS